MLGLVAARSKISYVPNYRGHMKPWPWRGSKGQGGRDWPAWKREATWSARPGAAVHRHTLDRVNAINDSLKKKKSKGQGRCSDGDICALPKFWQLGQVSTVDLGGSPLHKLEWKNPAFARGISKVKFLTSGNSSYLLLVNLAASFYELPT